VNSNSVSLNKERMNSNYALPNNGNNSALLNRELMHNNIALLKIIGRDRENPKE
jgi:hypothetical protein